MNDDEEEGLRLAYDAAAEHARDRAELFRGYRERKKAAPANDGTYRPPPETDVPYDEDHPCNDPHF